MLALSVTGPVTVRDATSPIEKPPPLVKPPSVPTFTFVPVNVAVPCADPLSVVAARLPIG